MKNFIPPYSETWAPSAMDLLPVANVDAYDKTLPPVDSEDGFMLHSIFGQRVIKPSIRGRTIPTFGWTPVTSTSKIYKTPTRISKRGPTLYNQLDSSADIAKMNQKRIDMLDKPQVKYKTITPRYDAEHHYYATKRAGAFMMEKTKSEDYKRREEAASMKKIVDLSRKLLSDNAPVSKPREKFNQNRMPVPSEIVQHLAQYLRGVQKRHPQRLFSYFAQELVMNPKLIEKLFGPQNVLDVKAQLIKIIPLRDDELTVSQRKIIERGFSRLPGMRLSQHVTPDSVSGKPIRPKNRKKAFEKRLAYYTKKIQDVAPSVHHVPLIIRRALAIQYATGKWTFDPEYMDRDIQIINSAYRDYSLYGRFMPDRPDGTYYYITKYDLEPSVVSLFQQAPIRKELLEPIFLRAEEPGITKAMWGVDRRKVLPQYNPSRNGQAQETFVAPGRIIREKKGPTPSHRQKRITAYTAAQLTHSPLIQPVRQNLYQPEWRSAWS